MNAAINIGLLSSNPTVSECTDSISGICILIAEYKKLLKRSVNLSEIKGEDTK